MGKKALVFCVVFAICFLGLGGLFKSRVNDFKGINVMSGYSINGQIHIDDNHRGTIGGNSKAEEDFLTLSTFFFVMGGIFTVASLGLGVSTLAKSNKIN